ncbi:bifunctional ADP-dependent NAD(P)H-hydrate dehydratase/NAD(P)H-hydrate epimerase [Virgibacillus sp. MSP4-1]|uniref:bifunctional ADP-dependent NAD(P)H-hydrate dehydratase/NAD(P)H-hydrate epimerase n=1 Tax=Virgibacillus sp. MSP4-1 TaxID=2700081 RepID=UPI0003A675BD|nr:bifunctional ADP-dependent NAD(P)H-hydrate dehydratase/NAD(P)H-hydrate epimerase [Virgibacillus sp. MSP4-1]QHS22443.1 bifunctional ADP-dependent NAD(P)H-hydrate dehydratase/NAD(P)H-hydrate epimerase [Virgibacillus sp. MSP4-1]
MYAAGQKDMQMIDQFTIEQLGLPGPVLMENAGFRVAEEVMKHLSHKQSKVIVLAGSGNNGGDGFVVARRLYDSGINVQLCLMVNPDRIKGDARVHFDVYINRELPFVDFSEKSPENLSLLLEGADVIVDAILGTGVQGPVRKPIDEMIATVNQYSEEKMILAVDIPSGIGSDNGRAESTAVKATKTITFVFPKKGFFLNQGPAYIGEWEAVDISVPVTNAEKLDLYLPSVITKDLAKTSIPARIPQGHKGTFGHVLVIGGSRPYIGAPMFTAKTAIHTGSGLVTLAIPESLYPVAASQNPESLMLPLPDKDGHLNDEALDVLSRKLDQFDSIAIGPGLSRFPNGKAWMSAFLRLLQDQHLIVDADGLYFLQDELDILPRLNGNVILTPHPGEMARLLGTTVKKVEENRINVAWNFAHKYKVYLLLKGHRSVIATPDKDIFINPIGHDALSKGGSGDVLTGLIASFLAQKAAPHKALIAAVYLHAKAGEHQAGEWSRYGVTPTELTIGIKKELRDLTE